MRWMGIGMLVFAFALADGAGANARDYNSHHSGPIKSCYTPSGTAYKPGDYCYTSCAPAAACQVEMCFADGEWMDVFPCKQRDCRKLCL